MACVRTGSPINAGISHGCRRELRRAQVSASLTEALLRVSCLLLAVFLEFLEFFVRLLLVAISVAAGAGVFALHYLDLKDDPECALLADDCG
jgi:hypothetical protein